MKYPIPYTVAKFSLKNSTEILIPIVILSEENSFGNMAGIIKCMYFSLVESPKVSIELNRPLGISLIPSLTAICIWNTIIVTISITFGTSPNPKSIKNTGRKAILGIG